LVGGDHANNGNNPENWPPHAHDTHLI
jgi:hypothetical protein